MVSRVLILCRFWARPANDVLSWDEVRVSLDERLH